MPPPFRPVVQAGDLANVVKAHGEMFDSKRAIYGLHSQLLKVAGIANSPKLKAAALVWLDHSDMFVSTSFDILHFEAQIRDRANRGLTQFVVPMEATLVDIKGRNAIAIAALPAAEADLEKEYLKLLPESASQQAKDRLKAVFETIVRGKGRPDNLPKPPPGPPGGPPP